MPKKSVTPKPPAFLVELLEARSPSGFEDEARAVVAKYVKPKANTFEVDALGGRAVQSHFLKQLRGEV